MVASGAVLSAGLSVGYVLWLARGGVLMASVLSALPAWATLDPLPILAQVKRKGVVAGRGSSEDDEDDSVETLFGKAPQRGMAAGSARTGNVTSAGPEAADDAEVAPAKSATALRQHASEPEHSA